MNITAKVLRESLHGFDLVTKHKGQFKFYRTFFYRHGMNDDKFAADIFCRLEANFPSKFEFVESGEVWKPFRGGASIQASSHFFAIFKLKGE